MAASSSGEHLSSSFHLWTWHIIYAGTHCSMCRLSWSCIMPRYSRDISEQEKRRDASHMECVIRSGEP